MSTAPRLIIEIDPAFFEIIERTRSRIAALAAKVGSDLFPLPWTGKVELVPIGGEDGDNDAPFVVRDASGAEIAMLYERYQDGKPLHELAGERIVAAGNAAAAEKAAPEPAIVRKAIHRALTAVEGDAVSAYTKDPTDAAADAVMAVLTDLGMIPGEGGRHG